MNSTLMVAETVGRSEEHTSELQSRGHLVCRLRLEKKRRFAFRRLGDSSGFPFLTAGRFPELLTYQPIGLTEVDGEPLPTRVRTPFGLDVELRGEELRSEIARRSGHAVELMMFKHGIFDDGA